MLLSYLHRPKLCFLNSFYTSYNYNTPDVSSWMGPCVLAHCTSNLQRSISLCKIQTGSRKDTRLNVTRHGSASNYLKTIWWNCCRVALASLLSCHPQVLLPVCAASAGSATGDVHQRTSWALPAAATTELLDLPVWHLHLRSRTRLWQITQEGDGTCVFRVPFPLLVPKRCINSLVTAIYGQSVQSLSA